MKYVYSIIFYTVLNSGLWAQNVTPTIVSRVEKVLTEEGYTNHPIHITDHYTSGDITHTYYKSSVNGIPVFNSRGAFHENIAGYTFINNQLIKGLRAENKTPAINLIDAIRSVNIYEDNRRFENYSLLKLPEGYQQKQVILAEEYSLSPIKGELEYYVMDDRSLRLIWDFSIERIDNGYYINYLVDASTGNLLEKIDWTVECNHGPICNEHKDIGQKTKKKALDVLMQAPNTYKVYPLPIESPNFGDSAIVSSPWLSNGIASPNGWHHYNGVDFTTSRGNNTDTYLDDNDTNSPTGGDAARADGGEDLEFIFPLDLGGDPSMFPNAAITNTFYFTNIMHDVWYNYGFDEASGNFQQENYTPSGIGVDYVRAEVQDGSGTCNANFSTPPDGSRPRMQMYLCNGRDGDLDNGVIAHEYGHGISNRLTGGPSASSCLSNQEQMGEGWSDFFAVIMTIQSGDLGTDARPMGTWLVGQGPEGNGIRPYPYSTDMSINPMTYNSIKTLSVPHGVGSVWATMLWDLSWALIEEYGWDSDLYNGTGGNNMAMNLIMEGLKIQPCSPGFVDGRDAILEANNILGLDIDPCLIWEVFANRGLGYSASQGSSKLRGDGIEAYDMPPSCTLEFVVDSDVDSVLPGGVIEHKLKVTNRFDTTVTYIEVWDSITNDVTFLNASNGGTFENGVITYPSFSLGPGESDSVYFTVSVRDNLHPIRSGFSDDMECGSQQWISENYYSTYWQYQDNESSSGDWVWYAPDASSLGLANLDWSEEVILSSSSILSFVHKYDTEADWDGGLVLISLDNKETWIDLGNHMVSNGYNGLIYNSQPGFSGYSDFVTTIIDLSHFAGKSAHIRFQMNCDQYVGGNGWWIDDVVLSNTGASIKNKAYASASGITRVDVDNVLINPDLTKVNGYISGTNPTCSNLSNGYAIAHIYGGTEPYTFIWENGMSTDSIPDLSEGTYAVTVADDSSVFIDSISIISPDPINIHVESTPILDIGDENGELKAIVNGGILNYSYIWENGDVEEHLTGLSSGVYEVTVTDNKECTASQVGIVDNPFLCRDNLLKIHIQTDQFADEFSFVIRSFSGEVLLEGGPYTNEDGSIEIIDFICLEDDCYTMSVFDSNADGLCNTESSTPGFVKVYDYWTDSMLVDVCDFGSGMTEFFCFPNSLSLNIEYSEVSCGGSDDGAVNSLGVVGATGNLSYLWSNGATTETINNLSPGMYWITVTDDVTSVVDSIEIMSDGYTKVFHNGDDGIGSLRYALENGCSTDTIVFDMALYKGVIHLNSGSIETNGTKYIDGLGMNNLTIQSTNGGTILKVMEGAHVVMKNVEIINVNATQNDSSVISEGQLSLENVALHYNGESEIVISVSNLGELNISDFVKIRN